MRQEVLCSMFLRLFHTHISMSTIRYLKLLLIVVLILLTYCGYTIFNKRAWHVVQDLPAHLQSAESYRHDFSCCSAIDIAPVNTPDPW